MFAVSFIKVLEFVDTTHEHFRLHRMVDFFKNYFATAILGIEIGLEWDG